MHASSRDKIRKRSAAPGQLIVCEKQSGIPRFRVEVNGDRAAALQRAATLLALSCSLRGDRPVDYEIRVPAHASIRHRITKIASELLRIGNALSSPVSLSPRERQVLREIMRNRVNKEIADRLHISLRTVKFHVSALLAKFRVTSRWDLVQQVQRIFGARYGEELFPSVPANSSILPHAADPMAARKAVASSQRARREEARIVPFRSHLRPA